VSEWAYVLALGPQLTLLPLLFPDGRPPTSRWRVLVWASGATLSALVLAFALMPQVHVTEDRLLANPVGGWPLAQTVGGPLLLLLGGCALACATALVVRLRRADPTERRRIAPYVGAIVGALVALLAARAVDIPEPVVQTAALPLLPVAATLCVLRYRLYDLELVVRRSLVWLGLTVALVLGYALVVEAVANLLRREAGLPESLIAAGAVAVAFAPTRAWLQRAVSRALYGQRDDPDAVLLVLGQSMSMTAEPLAALDRAARRIAESLATPWVAVHVLREGSEPRVTQTGRRPVWADDDAITRLPLVHVGVEHGALLVSRRSPKEVLSGRDRRLLEGLAYPLAVTAAAFRLTDDLRRSRERLVVAREEERRRLRHDLHDELGPLLASFTVQVDAAVLRQQRTGQAPVELLTELRTTAHDAVNTVRRAVEQLRPPALDELGLVTAVTEQVRHLEPADGPRIDVYAPRPLPALPAAVEVAGHRIAIEAVTNAVRHARARTVSVRFETTEGGDLLVEVRDDGQGIPAHHRPGVGTTSMRERAEELGGRLDLGPAVPSGTTVRAILPLGPTP
jgi:signal transduction histidine kinase